MSKEFIATVDEIREAYNNAWYDTDIEHINYALQKMLSDKLICVNNVLIRTDKALERLEAAGFSVVNSKGRYYNISS